MVGHQVDLGVEQELVSQVKEVSLQQEEQEVALVREAEVEQELEEHLHLEKLLRQVRAEQVEVGVNVT